MCRNAQPDLSWFKPANFTKNLPIQLDEDAETVTVEGGVQTRVLLDYLAKTMWVLPS